MPEENAVVEAKATLRFARISSRKVKIVADLIRGKKVDEALAIVKFTPKASSKTIEKLLNTFGTEMDILHKLSKDDIESVVGEKVANTIIDAREGNIKIQSGGGGVYGKLTAS